MNPTGEEKRLSNNKRSPTIKQKKFAQEFVKTSDGTKSALAVYDINGTPPQRHKTASVIASENLGKPEVRQEIERLYEQAGLDMQTVLAVHKRNMTQETNLSVSQTAVRDYLNVVVKSDNENKGNTNLAFIFNDNAQK